MHLTTQHHRHRHHHSCQGSDFNPDTVHTADFCIIIIICLRSILGVKNKRQKTQMLEWLELICRPRWFCGVDYCNTGLSEALLHRLQSVNRFYKSHYYYNKSVSYGSTISSIIQSLLLCDAMQSTLLLWQVVCPSVYLSVHP